MTTLLILHLVIATASLMGLLYVHHNEFEEVLVRDFLLYAGFSFLIPVCAVAGIVMAFFYWLGQVFKNKLDKKLF